MNVKKIFITLVIIVACVMIGALILNVLLPNVTTSLINATEDMIHSATGMSFDFNGDGNTGADDNVDDMNDQSDEIGDDGAGVEGFN